MKIIAPLILIIFGGIWFLQGVGVLPGSFMTGQLQWAFIGGALIVAGGVILFMGRSKP